MEASGFRTRDTVSNSRQSSCVFTHLYDMITKYRTHQAKPRDPFFQKMASHSASSSSTPPKLEYEVFLSFRGEDTRNNFVSHLYAALDQRGITTYIDENSLQSGQSISPQLLKSIEEAKFSIIVFSKNYASSTWCLNELVKIMECKAVFGQGVIPVFYDVGPADVRNQENSFAESFAKHQVSFRDEVEKVKAWREALSQAADLVGVDMRGRNEALCIKKIVKEIFSKLCSKASTKGLVGIESHMKKLSSLLFKKPDDVCFVGIWGMGGVGKTTIARAIFDKLIGGFDGGCFLHDVSKREMVDLQKILLSKVLKLEQVPVSDVYEGRSIVKSRLRFKRVLLVLDDVDDIKQLNLLAGERNWFGNGSRIIITTRDKCLLNEVNETYEVDLLSDNEAMQLFCWHAFKNSSCPAGNFGQLSHGFVNYARGLPLALEVLGCYLYQRGANDWKSALDRLKDAGEDQNFATLEISFEGLIEIQQQIFLDIACFFRGESEGVVIRKLDSFRFHPADGIAALIQKSLLCIYHGKIQMHDLIQEMGHRIVRRRANKVPGKFSRLWLPDDIIDVLTDNTGTVRIEGMVLREHHEINLREGAFRNMNRLRLLEIHGGYFSRSPDHLTNQLRWLHWARYPGKSLPEHFEPRKLVSLILPGSQIIQTPDILGMPNLEVLDLHHSKQLVEVHPSVGAHKKLIHLNLYWCRELKRFPRIIQMESLEILDLSNCLEFQNFPEIQRYMSCLRVISLRKTKIRELPWSVGYLTILQKLNLNYCYYHRALPGSICWLKNLEHLSLVGCSKLHLKFENSDGNKLDD